jgi:hypothetical protein
MLISKTSREPTAHLLTRDEARRIAVNIAKLPDCCSGRHPAASRSDVAAFDHLPAALRLIISLAAPEFPVVLLAIC